MILNREIEIVELLKLAVVEINRIVVKNQVRNVEKIEQLNND